MLAVGNLLEALSEKENTKKYKDCNDDHDFGKVLEYYNDSAQSDYETMCSDGRKRNLLLND